MTDGKLLYEQLRTTVAKIGERLEQKHILSGLVVTNLSEVLKNNEVAVEMMFERNFMEGGFDTLVLVKKEELLKMRKKKLIFFRSRVVPKPFLRVIIDCQKVVCRIDNSTIPKEIVEEELKRFIRLYKEIDGVVVIR